MPITMRRRAPWSWPATRSSTIRATSSPATASTSGSTPRKCAWSAPAAGCAPRRTRANEARRDHAPCEGPVQELPRPPGRRRGLVLGRSGRGGRSSRSEWGGQDHQLPLRGWPPGPGRGRGAPRRSRSLGTPPARARAHGDRLPPAGGVDLPQAHRPPELPPRARGVGNVPRAAGAEGRRALDGVRSAACRRCAGRDALGRRAAPRGDRALAPGRAAVHPLRRALRRYRSDRGARPAAADPYASREGARDPHHRPRRPRDLGDLRSGRAPRGRQAVGVRHAVGDRRIAAGARRVPRRPVQARVTGGDGMALELKQSLRLSQQLVMTPQLQQAIKLLQLSRLELVDLIRSEMEQNPLLEEPQEGAETELNEAPPELVSTLNQSIEASELAAPAPEVAQPDLKARAEGDVKRDDIDWEQYLDNYQTQHTAPSGGGYSSEDLPSIESTLTRAQGLAERFMEQLRMADLSPEEERVGALIIGNLNRDGYLVVDPDVQPTIPVFEPAPVDPDKPVEVPAVAPEALEALRREQEARKPKSECDPLILLALEAGVSAAMAEKVLKKIQRFDPIGCAARDLRECLLVQAKHYNSEGEGKDDPDAELLPAIIRKHLKNVESKKYQAIARDLQVSLEEVVAAVKLLSRLDPKPGRNYSGEEAQYITPDVYIHKIGDQYVTVLNDDGLSKLRISQHYRNALKNGASPQSKEYIQEKLRSAVWLIRSIHQRQRTIVKVTDSIIKFQREFLDKGIAYLRPLILRDVAEDIGMHESTVSRVTTNKYVHTPQGIYELKFFFNSSIARANGGDDIASEAVKNQIRQIVSGEPGDKPYSDQKIVEILRSQNVDIARRTVAKYREE